MAIVPKRKTSKQRKRKRRSHNSLEIPNLVSVAGRKVPHRLVKFYQRENAVQRSSKKAKAKK